MNQPYALLTTADYIEYFATLVDKSNFIDEFYYTYQEVTEKGRSSKKGTFLCLEPYTNQISENQNDNVLGQRRGMFVIAKPVTQGVLAMRTIHDECEKLCYKIIGKIKRDSKAHILRAEISNWNGYETGLLTGSMFTGYAIEFNFQSPINRFLIEEAGDWIEEDPI